MSIYVYETYVFTQVLFGLKHTVATFEVSYDEWNVNGTQKGLAETLKMARFVSCSHYTNAIVSSAVIIISF